MGQEGSPLERELSSVKLARRSTMTTSVPANVSSAASIIPVGPPPAITTACSAIHHSSFPNACQETLHHTPGLAASPGGGAILRWRELGLICRPRRDSHAPAAAGVVPVPGLRRGLGQVLHPAEGRRKSASRHSRRRFVRSCSRC